MRKQYRGRCPTCGFRFRLTRAGAVYKHWLYAGDSRGTGHVCDGSGRQRRLERWEMKRQAEIARKQKPLNPRDVSILGGDPSL